MTITLLFVFFPLSDVIFAICPGLLTVSVPLPDGLVLVLSLIVVVHGVGPAGLRLPVVRRLPEMENNYLEAVQCSVWVMVVGYSSFHGD